MKISQTAIKHNLKLKDLHKKQLLEDVLNSNNKQGIRNLLRGIENDRYIAIKDEIQGIIFDSYNKTKNPEKKRYLGIALDWLKQEYKKWRFKAKVV